MQKAKISFYIDGQFVGTQATLSDMNGPMYLLANLVTQNDADAAGVPITVKIDYIWAYSKDPSAAAIAQGLISALDDQDPGFYGATSAGSTVLAPAKLISTPVATSIGTEPDQLAFKISQDAYQGDAQYTITVDGQHLLRLPQGEGDLFVREAFARHGIHPPAGFRMPETLALSADQFAGSGSVRFYIAGNAL